MIELRHLRYFIAVAEELNFRRAAERIHIDPTPLSRTIRDLEDHLGVLLILRRPRKLCLTPAGVRLFKESLNLFIRLERAQRVVRATDANHRAPLHIGVADGLAQPRLSQCLARWQAIAPEVPLELSEMRARELAAALCREEVDVGFSFGVPEDARIVQEPVWDYPLIALLPRGHELERQGALGLADLARFPMIVCHADHKPGVRRQIDALLAQCACAPSIAGEARTFMGCVTRIAAGLGVGVTDSGHAETLRRTDVSAVPLQGDLRLHTYVLYKHQRGGLPEAVQRFLTHTRSL